MKCPKCRMEIPDDAYICPYCHSRLRNSWGLPSEVDDLFKATKDGFQKGYSNSGCMVILPIIVVAAYSIYYLISIC